jgi:hypothetical protein
MSAAILPARMRARGNPGGGRGRRAPARPAGGERGPRDAEAGPRDVEELCRQFAPVCESAVDPLEICCALEFEGWSDKAVRDSYGIADVFTLAEQMFLRVPRRPAEPDEPPDPWQVATVRPALHGLLYGLPTVCFPAAAGLLAGPGVVGLLVVVSLVSWAITQSLAYLGYLWLGQADPARAARLLRAGLGAGLAGVLLALAVTGLVLPVRLPAVSFAAGLGAYMLGATVLIVLGAERLLLAAAAPGVLGGALFLLLGRPVGLTVPDWAALAATPLLALALAAARATHAAGGRSPGHGKHAGGRNGPTGRAGTGQARTGREGGRLVTGTELRGALPSAGFGLVAAGLFAFPVAAGLPGHASAGVLVSLPLAVSMGAAEWILIWFRRRTQRLLRSTGELLVFAARVRLALLAALLAYLAVTAALTAVVAAAAAGAQLAHPGLGVLPQVAAYLAVGGAMFTALLLQAFGSRVVPLACCAVALAVEAVCRSGGVTAQLLACTALLVGLAGYAALVLGSATRHAC